ncbi:MAG TPA: SDR family oxidoreductase [Candidatus Acidoferrales bacterium]|nr:SDR family oxidoreductase [Candidatus Acidoferrales bacterium]
MAIFLTGATGYIGAHVASILLDRHDDRLNLLVRAKTEQEANERLWQSLQLHLDFPLLREALESRISVFRGDLTEPHFGLDSPEYTRLISTTESVIHCAASLNRKSEKSCLNVNLRGTLEVVQLARRARDAHGLRRFSQVSTVAVAGHRSHEVVTEDAAIDWDRSDYDPYARTKKFCEHMVRELLPDVPRTVFRPSIVLGDSRRPETTQFDMVRAFVFLAGLPVLPFRSTDRIDIVAVDFVAEAIAELHQKPNPAHEIYHLSSGTGSETFGQLTRALARSSGKMEPLFWPELERNFSSVVNWLSNYRSPVGRSASLLKVFMPYLVWDTVFENSRVVAEMGRAPEPFSRYSYPLLRFSRDHGFSYPYRSWPGPADVNGDHAAPACVGSARGIHP